MVAFLVIYAVSFLEPVWLNHSLDPWFHLCKAGKLGVCLSELSQTLLSFYFLFILKLRVKSSSPALLVAQVSVSSGHLWRRSHCLLSPGLPMKRESGAGRSTHVFSGFDKCDSLGPVPCKGENEMDKYIY